MLETCLKRRANAKGQMATDALKTSRRAGSSESMRTNVYIDVYLQKDIQMCRYYALLDLPPRLS